VGSSRGMLVKIYSSNAAVLRGGFGILLCVGLRKFSRFTMYLSSGRFYRAGSEMTLEVGLPHHDISGRFSEFCSPPAELNRGALDKSILL
jgi:hypothetical protein